MYKLYANNVCNCMVSDSFWNLIHYVNTHYSLDNIVALNVRIRIFVHTGRPDLYTTLDSVIIHNMVGEIRDMVHDIRRYGEPL